MFKQAWLISIGFVESGTDKFYFSKGRVTLDLYNNKASFDNNAQLLYCDAEGDVVRLPRKIDKTDLVILLLGLELLERNGIDLYEIVM